jgi:hypothetical protein
MQKVRRRPRTSLLVLLVLGGWAVRSPARAEESERKESAELTALLDRWTDNPPEQRLARAAELAERRLRRSGDPESALQAARLRLAREDWGGATSLALKLRDSPERARAAAIEYLALVESGARTLRDRTGSERQSIATEYVARRAAHSREWNAAVGTAAFCAVLTDEARHCEHLRSLDSLGRPISVSLGEPVSGVAAPDSGRVTFVDFVTPETSRYLETHKHEAPALESARKKMASFFVICVADSRTQAESTTALVQAPWNARFLSAKSRVLPPRFPSRYVIDGTGRVRFVNVWGDDLKACLEELGSHEKGR